jgi:4-hydroxyphenylpyruvate dioxygenase
MKRSIATVSLPGLLRDKLEAIAAAGFEGVEIFEPNLKTFDGSPRQVGQFARDLGLTMRCSSL